MKKLLFSLLISLIVIGMCGCGANTSTESETPKEIELTLSNYKEYLNIETKIGAIEKSNILGTMFYDSTITANIYPVQPGSFSNVKMTVTTNMPFGWYVASTDPSFDEENEFKAIFEIALPANGTISKDIEIGAMGMAPSDVQTYSPFVSSISGKFIPAN